MQTTERVVKIPKELDVEIKELSKKLNISEDEVVARAIFHFYLSVEQNTEEFIKKWYVPISEYKRLTVDYEKLRKSIENMQRRIRELELKLREKERLIKRIEEENKVLVEQLVERNRKWWVSWK